VECRDGFGDVCEDYGVENDYNYDDEVMQPATAERTLRETHGEMVYTQ